MPAHMFDAVFSTKLRKILHDCPILHPDADEAEGFRGESANKGYNVPMPQKLPCNNLVTQRLLNSVRTQTTTTAHFNLPSRLGVRCLYVS